MTGLSHHHHLRRAGAGALALALVALPACSTGEREGWAKDIQRAADRTLTGEAITGELSIRVQPQVRKGTAAQANRIAAASLPPLPVVLEPRTRRAVIGTSPAGPTMVFTDAATFQRRPASSAANVVEAGGIALPTNLPALVAGPPPQPVGGGTEVGSGNQRPWVLVSFNRLDERDTGKVAGSYGMNPINVLVLFRGVLTGSLKRVGTAEVDGVEATHYRMRVGIDKATRRFKESEREDFGKVLRAHAISGLVHDAQVWIGPDGSIVQASITFNQALDRVDRSKMTVTLSKLRPAPGAPPITIPTREETARVPTFGLLVQAMANA